jgi:Xaa-Pro dipeptidase
VWNDVEGYEGAFARALDELALRGKTLGVDGMTMRVTEWLAFSRIDPTLEVTPVEHELIRIRAQKTPDEVAAMRRAIAISEAALSQLLTEVQPGMSEKAIAARLDALMIEGGSDGLAFESLVQTGPNSANPHGSSTQRPLQKDEFLLIDYGCKVDGYPADITRTFCLGAPSAEMQKIYDTVLHANEAAKAVAKPGVPCEQVDRAARQVIDQAGYGQYFIHRTGHGLGLDTHEPIPQIADGVEYPLTEGMTFTIEPGIYVPGLGGVRVEDNVLVTDTGLEVLTNFPRFLRLDARAG